MAALYGNLQELHPETDDVATYLERVELYFIANETPEEKQVLIFLNVIGGTAYGLLRSLLAPDDPKDKSLDALIKLLKDHYEPKRNIVAERFHFHRRDQKPGESLSDYVAELRRLAARCSFDRAYLEEVLRDRFICGVQSEAVQKKLLTEPDVNFQKAVEIAKNWEAANKSAQAFKAPADLTVGAVTLPPKASGSQVQAGSTVVASKPCSCCGKTGHVPRDCRFKGAICHRCKKKGHLARACRGGKMKPRGRMAGPTLG